MSTNLVRETNKKRVLVRVYTVNHITEECFCQNCGYPMYFDDRVYQSKASDITYCGLTCFNQMEAQA